MMMEDFKEEYLREVRGVQSEHDVFPCFNHAHVNSLLHESAIYTGIVHPKNIYTIIDPACGGNRSKHTVVSSMFTDGLMIVSIILFN
jgi:hypothetical protein